MALHDDIHNISMSLETLAANQKVISAALIDIAEAIVGLQSLGLELKSETPISFLPLGEIIMKLAAIKNRPPK